MTSNFEPGFSSAACFNSCYLASFPEKYMHILAFHTTYLVDAYCRLPTIQQEVQQRKLLYMGLYLLIWGEAANLRFMPECLCYIYHHVCFVT